MSWRRFEILLPVRFNDGELVPNAVIAETLLELERRFGAESWETQIIRGLWRHEGEAIQDDSLRIIVDVQDILENREFFREYKESLKVRFRQTELWITTHVIDVV